MVARLAPMPGRAIGTRIHPKDGESGEAFRPNDSDGNDERHQIPESGGRGIGLACMGGRGDGYGLQKRRHFNSDPNFGI